MTEREAFEESIVKRGWQAARAAPAQPTLKKLLKDFEGFPDYSGPGVKQVQEKK